MADADADLRRELAALALWADFPARRSPRPLVLTGADPVRVPLMGFPDDDHKAAFLAGAVVARAVVPAGVLAALRGDARPYAGKPLVVSSAARAEAEWASDRGPVLLPAWNVAVDDVSGLFVVLDPDTAAQAWAPGRSRHADSGGYDAAVGDPDEVSFTLMFVGSPDNVIDYHPPLRVHLSPGAVVVGLPVAVDLLAGGWRTALGQRREIAVELPEALRGRVLVSPYGQPIPVLRSTAP